MKRILPLLLLAAACGHPTPHPTTPTPPTGPDPTPPHGLALPAGWAAATAVDPADGITYLTITARGGSSVMLSFAQETCARWSDAEDMNHATAMKLDAALAADGWIGDQSPDMNGMEMPLDLCRPSGAGSVQAFVTMAADDSDATSDVDAVLAMVAHDADTRGTLATDFATSSSTVGAIGGILAGWQVVSLDEEHVSASRQLGGNDGTQITIDLGVEAHDCGSEQAPRPDDDRDSDPGQMQAAPSPASGWSTQVLAYIGEDDPHDEVHYVYCRALGDGRSLVADVLSPASPVPEVTALLESVGAATK